MNLPPISFSHLLKTACRMVPTRRERGKLDLRCLDLQEMTHFEDLLAGVRVTEQVVEDDWEYLNCDDASFELVTIGDQLIRNQLLAFHLYEIARVLVPSGMLVVQLPNLSYRSKRDLRYTHLHVRKHAPLCAFTTLYERNEGTRTVFGHPCDWLPPDRYSAIYQRYASA